MRNGRAVLEGDRAERFQPVDVGEVPGFGPVLDYDEEIEVRMVIESPKVRPDRPESDQREGIATIGQDPAQLVEAGEQPAGKVRRHAPRPGWSAPPI